MITNTIASDFEWISLFTLIVRPAVILSLTAMMIKETERKPGHPWLTVEPVLLGVYLATNVCNQQVFGDWLMTQACWFGKRDSLDDGLECLEREAPVNKAREITRIFSLVHTTMVFVIPSLIGFLMASKRCKLGRKPMILIPLIGQLLMWITLSVSAKLRSGNPFWTILASSFSMMSGGFVFSVAGCLSYVTDIATPEKVALRFGMCAATDVLSKLISTYLTPVLTVSGDYFNVFLFASVSVGGSLLYAACFLPETINFDNELTKKIIQLKVITLPRDDVGRMKTRKTVVLTLILTAITSLYVSGEESSLYTSVWHRFSWAPSMFSSFVTTYCFLYGFWLTIGVWLLSVRMKIRDFFMMVILCQIVGLSGVLAAQAASLQFFMAAMGLGSMLLVPSVIYKSFVVSVVDCDKRASTVSRVVYCEAIASTLGPCLYAYVLNHISDPMYIFYVKTVFCLLGLVFLRLIYVVGESDPKRIQVFSQAAPNTQAIWMLDNQEGFSKTTLALSGAEEKIWLVPKQ